jgi:hypothetical protein
LSKKDDLTWDNRFVSYENGNRNQPAIRRLKKEKKGEKKNEENTNTDAHRYSMLVNFLRAYTKGKGRSA